MRTQGVNSILSLAMTVSLVALEVIPKPVHTISEALRPGRQMQKAKLGVRIYSPSYVIQFQDTDEIVSADLETSDAPEKVIAFYEQELRAQRDATGMVMMRKGNRTYLVSAVREDGKTLVWIMGQR